MTVWQYESHYFNHPCLMFTSPEACIKHMELDAEWRPYGDGWRAYVPGRFTPVASLHRFTVIDENAPPFGY